MFPSLSLPFRAVAWRRCFSLPLSLYLVFRNRFHFDHLAAPVGNEIRPPGRSPEHSFDHHSLVLPIIAACRSFASPTGRDRVSRINTLSRLLFSHFALLGVARTAGCCRFVISNFYQPLVWFPFFYFIRGFTCARRTSRNEAAIRFHMAWAQPFACTEPLAIHLGIFFHLLVLSHFVLLPSHIWAHFYRFIPLVAWFRCHAFVWHHHRRYTDLIDLIRTSRAVAIAAASIEIYQWVVKFSLAQSFCVILT